MKPRTFYRLAVWLPFAAPAAAVALGVGGQMTALLAVSVIFGGLPYALLAAWATWWMGGKTERDIRRLMFGAPLLMLGVYVIFVAVIGAANSKPERTTEMIGAGAGVIVPLGYLYVGLVVAIRRVLGPLISSET